MVVPNALAPEPRARMDRGLSILAASSGMLQCMLPRPNDVAVPV